MATKRKTATRKQEPQAKVLKYALPDAAEIHGKALVRLAQSGIMFSAIQIIEDGGDNNLHSHAAMDGSVVCAQRTSTVLWDQEGCNDRQAWPSSGHLYCARLSILV